MVRKGPAAQVKFPLAAVDGLEEVADADPPADGRPETLVAVALRIGLMAACAVEGDERVLDRRGDLAFGVDAPPRARGR